MTKTVLVVEDDPGNRMLMETLLDEEGYAVLVSSTGEDAMDLARAHRPGIILMDINLPKVDGRVRIREFKADPALSSIPIIAVTTQVMRGDEESVRASGCDEYLSKPFDVGHLLALVERLYR